MIDSLIERERQSILQTYGRLPIQIENAKGAYIYDVDGNEYLDFLGGIAVNILGHSHPKIIEAIHNQASKYLHVSNFFFQEPQIELAEKLKRLSGLDKVFFSNSGAESTEGAIKIVRKWGYLNNKKNILAFKGGFHGRTYGALSIMDKPKYKDKMGPFFGDVIITNYNDVDLLRKNINDDTEAVFLELIQGEGGLAKATKEWVDTLIELKSIFKFLIVVDEVQTGMFRTGKLFSYEHYNLKPDIVTTAKGLGGGIPIGAILVTKELSEILEKGQHGTTFGGNALACAVGSVVIDILENELNEHIQNISNYLKNKLENLVLKYEYIIDEYRGMGLMCGLNFKINSSQIVSKLLERKIIANSTSETVLRLLPPFIIGKREVDIFIENLSQILDEIMT